MHIFRAVCIRRKITYEEFAKAVRTLSGKDSPGAPWIAQVASGLIPSPELAADIEAAFPEIRREWLIWPDRYRDGMEQLFPEIREDNGTKKASGE